MEQRTKEEFMDRFRAVKRHVLTRALNRLTPGINWSRSSKGHIAEQWASKQHCNWTRLDRVELDDLQQSINKVLAGDES